MNTGLFSEWRMKQTQDVLRAAAEEEAKRQAEWPKELETADQPKEEESDVLSDDQTTES